MPCAIIASALRSNSGQITPCTIIASALNNNRPRVSAGGIVFAK
jgi:hypothetical protein